MKNNIMNPASNFFSDEAGATAVEYAVMIGLIILACIGGITVFGGETVFTWNSNAQEISDAMTN